MSDFTPGPWKAAASFNDPSLIAIQAGRGPDIARIRLYPDLGIPTESDARLIAAAPELLDALKDVDAFLGVMFGDANGKVPASVSTPIGVPVKLGAIVADMRAAIAKATAKAD